ncbi:MAG: tetratricopeptide repeat protein [Bacteroidales bacterium]|nr:tetratricopeptide repeat protein [Bacteroidales bacterium]
MRSCKPIIYRISLLLFSFFIIVLPVSGQSPDKATLYNEKVNQAEKLFFEKNYQQAKKTFQEARKLKPDERHPAARISEINKILGIQEEDNTEFSQAVTKADAFYKEEKYAQALDAYMAANDIAPGDEHVTARVIELNKLLREKQAKEKGYEAAMKLGSQFYENRQLDKAKEQIEIALSYDPASLDAKSKLAEISKILEVREQYENAVKEADDLYVDQDYDAAKLAYNRALSIKPTESYPQNMILRIDEMIMKKESDALALENSYKEAVLKGDEHFLADEYELAKSYFEEASRLKPAESYPRARITEINNLFAELEVKEQQYLQAVAQGDDHFSRQSWDAALAEYHRAEKLKPGEPYPGEKIAEITGVLSGLTDAEYQSVMAQGEILLQQKSYDQAILTFQKAIELKPGENLPKDKISEINGILADFAQAEENYQTVIATGNQLLAVKDYEKAIETFSKASAMRPEDEYPKSRIAEINTILAGIEAVEADYQEAIKAGDEFFRGKSYESALAEFQKASELKREEVYPKIRISEITALLATISESEAEYQFIIKEANQLLDQKNYNQALTEFQKASNLKPEEMFPKSKITEINSLLAELAEMEVTYQATINLGDQLFGQKEYNQSLAEFQKASNLKPDENYPKEKIAEINTLLAGLAETDAAYQAAITRGDQLFSQKEYDQALAEFEKASSLKPEENYAKEKIAEINTLLAGLAETDAAYQAAITRGDQLFGQKSYDQAVAEFQKASDLKPEENYPKSKITEINTLLAGLAETDAAYQAAITRGDQLFSQKEYDQAVAEFQKASSLKPVENYPKEKIAEINTLLAGLAETDAAYQAAITRGDQLFLQKDYDQAVAEFQKASNLKPDENYPKEKIAEINTLLTGLAETDAAYQAAITRGDQLFGQKSYDQAVAEFQKASDLKPDENYPKEKITEINTLLAGLAETDAAYQAAITLGDQLFGQKEYNQSLAEFQKASDLKPEEIYPKSKIDEISTIFRKIAETNTAYESAIEIGEQFVKEEKFDLAKAEFQKATELKPAEEYPKNKLIEIDALAAELAEKQLQYNNFITAGDFHYDAGNLHEAKVSYNSALAIFPNSSYPKDKTAAIDVTLREELERIQKEYNAAVAEADRLFGTKAYDDAINQYQIASGIKPDETYPQSRISEITKIIEANVVVDVVKTIEIVESNVVSKYGFSPVPRQGRRESYIILKARNLSEHDFRVFLNYGKDETNNGGFVINIPNSVQTRDYIVKVGGQYRWFSEDNNWISLQPEGGNVEVSMIQISQE